MTAMVPGLCDDEKDAWAPIKFFGGREGRGLSASLAHPSKG